MWKPPTNEKPGADGVKGEFYRTSKNQYQPISGFSKNRRGRSTSQLILWDQHYPDTKTRKSHQKRTTGQSSFMNMYANILINILANHIQQGVKRITHHDQVGKYKGKHKRTFCLWLFFLFWFKRQLQKAIHAHCVDEGTKPQCFFLSGIFVLSSVNVTHKFRCDIRQFQYWTVIEK